MEFADELLHLGDAALEDEIAVIGLAVRDIPGDGREHQFAYLFGVLGLAQSPAQLDVGDLGEEVFAGHDAHAHQVPPGVVDEHVHEAPEGLDRHVDMDPFGDGAADGGIEGLVDMPKPGAGDDDALVAILSEGIDDVRMHVRIVINDRHALLEIGQDIHLPVRAAGVVSLHRDHGIPGYAGNGDVPDGAEGAAVGGVHLADPCAAVEQALFVAGGAEHADHHLGDVRMTRGVGGVHEVEGGVRGRAVAGALRTHHHDGDGQVLKHVGKGRRGVVHGVRAMADDDALDALRHFLSDGDGELLILLGAHVLRKNGEKLFGIQVADLRQFGHGAVEFAGRESGDDGPGAVIQPGGDRSAGTEQLHLRQARREGEFLFRDLVMRFPVAGLLHAFDGIHVDAHIVACGKLDDDVPVVVVFAAGQDDPLKDAAGGADRAFAPYPGLEALEYLEGAAFVSFEKIKHD
jgi:hypothetical protein